MSPKVVDQSLAPGARARTAAILVAALFATGSAALSAQAVPGPASVREPLDERRAPMADDTEAEFALPTRLDRAGRIVAPVEIDGRPLRFILDTGANRSVVSQRTALRLGLEIGPDPIGVHGITGHAHVPAARVAEFRAGTLKFRNLLMPVLPDAVFGEVDGILGVDCLQQARVEVDFALDRVTIQRSPSRRGATGRLVVPAKLRFGGLLLIEGRVGRVKAKVLLDTGAERSLGNDALRSALLARGAQPTEETRIVIGATHQLAQGSAFLAPPIDLGGAKLKDLSVTFGDLHVFDVWSLRDEPTLLVGMDLLGTLKTFVVDYPRREFHFST